MGDKDTLGLLKLLAKKKSNHDLEYKLEGKSLVLGGHDIAFISYDKYSRYPQYRNALPTDLNYMPPAHNDNVHFGISAKYLRQLEKALVLNKQSPAVKVHLMGEGKGIIFKPINESHQARRLALIMPITLRK